MSNSIVNNQNSATNGMLELAAINSSRALFLVQQSTAETILQGGKYQETMAHNMMKLGQNAINEAIQNLQKVINEQEDASKAAFWEKLFGGILTAVVAIVACVTSQPEIAVVAIALYAAQLSGGLKAAEGGIADVLHSAFGLKKSIGRLIGSFLIIAASVAVGGGARAVVSKVISLAGKGAIAAAEGGASAATEEATQTASTSIKARLTSLLKKIPAPLARALTTGSMAMSSANLSGNLSAVIAKNNLKLEEALGAIVGILSLLVGLVGGSAMGVQSSAGGLTALSTNVLKGSGYAGGLANAGEAGSGGATGYFNFQQGLARSALTKANAKTELYSEIKDEGMGQWGGFLKQMESILQSEGKASAQVAKGMSAANAWAAHLMA